MDERREQSDQSHPEELPKGLSEQLLKLYRGDLPVPPEVDEAILGAAHHRLNNLRRFRMLLRWGGAAAAAAAAVALAIWQPWQPARHAAHPPIVAQSSPRPAGQYDMLDAYHLARMLKDGQRPGAEWDVNHDGVVDQKDVDRMAELAVRVQ